MILTVTLNAAIDKRYEIKGFCPGEVNRVSRCTYGAGGKGMNVARVATLAGEKVVATGFIGGYTGSLIEEDAREQGIITEFVRRKEESRICINILDTGTGTQTEILEEGEPVMEGEEAKMLEKYRQLLSGAEVVSISGSVPKGVSSGLYAKMIELANNAHLPVLLDTSGSSLKNSLRARPTLIKPNKEELEQLLECEITKEEEYHSCGARLQEEGIPYVVISLGEKGSLLVAPSGTYRARVPELEAVNTVGCGDSMIAGFAIGFRQRWKDEEMLRYASAISAANALRVETGYFKKADFDELYPRIIIEKL